MHLAIESRKGRVWLWLWLWLRGGDLGSRGEITAVQLMGLTFLWLGWLSWLYWI